MTISPAVVRRAKNYVDKVKHAGFVALAVDDTKLTPAVRTYWDDDRSTWVLIGVAGEPPEVADEKELEQMIDEAKANLAVKVCSVPPLLIAKAYDYSRFAFLFSLSLLRVYHPSHSPRLVYHQVQQMPQS